jgi:hypothetical protein
MDDTEDQPEVEGTAGLHLALMRRSLPELANDSELCDDCGRRLLLGERVYEFESGAHCCQLCRAQRGGEAISVHVVHSPAFGRAIRIVERRSSAQAA